MAEASNGEAVDAAEVAAMVERIDPSWTVRSVDAAIGGSDFVCPVEVDRGDGTETVVLKAATSDWVDPACARAEPRLLDRVGDLTELPVPTVFGWCDRHPSLPAPFFLMSHEPGHKVEDSSSLAPSARERVLREAGRCLGELHGLDPPRGIGRVGHRDGQLHVIETEGAPTAETFHDWLLTSYHATLDDLEHGGYFPDLAREPDRFADLVEPVRRHLDEAVPNLPDPSTPALCHQDYRYGNLLLDPTTGATQAVLDWGLVMAAAPAFNLANAESLLLSPETEDPERTAALRETFYEAYAEVRPGFALDADTRERLEVYRVACRLDAMACLPLWYRDASSDERRRRAAAHRAFVRRYVDADP